ncbi:unnamed protein product [Malus baccata var. baccata]
MELIGFIQVFNLIVIVIGTLLYLCCKSLTFSSSSSSSGAGDAAAVDDKDDDVDIPPLPEKYDVFISFRGEDTRKTFTSHLRVALLRKKFETYIDYKLKKGDEIGPSLLEAIEKSRLSVIIFSKNYASSTWCLLELVHILKCRKKKGQMVVPIFYDINPSDVRKQKGSYADAFAQLEKRFKDSMGKVREWRKALRTAANLSGFDYSNNKGELKRFKPYTSTGPTLDLSKTWIVLLNVDSSSLVLRNSPFYYFETYGEYFPNLTLSLPSSLRYLFWKGYPLKSLPPKFSPDNLVELHMPYITRSSVELWNGGQNLVNLKVIDLRYSKRLTALPNLSRSPNIEHIDLSGCESLVKVPPHFKNLDKLTYLDLSDCKSLEYLPEMPGNIEFLCLRGSGIRELSSVWSHEKKISSLDIGFCEKLKKLPSSSCKLRVSGAFSLAGCYSLGNFWELPRDIGELDLSSTAIEVFPTSSMECLLRLTTLKLKNCKNLASLPTSICKLKSLEVLDLTGCTGFYEFPEILEPMEHLKFLCLEATAVEALTQSAGNLIGLQTLDLGWCKKLKAVPSSIYKLTNLKTLSLIKCTSLEPLPELPVEALPQSAGNLIGLQTLDLGWCKKLKAVPSSIYKLTNLKTLSLIKCMSLESLPELPVLSRLQADGCKLLKTVASSRTAITQCWNIYELLPEQVAFYNCRSMGYYDEASSNIMADAQLRIMRVATASSKLKEEEVDYEKFSEPLVTIVCPGYKIPNWFVHQNESASINVKLPPNWFREGFLGFALSVVASNFYFKGGLQFRGKYNFKTEEGESHEINCSFYVPFEDGENCGSTFHYRHVFVLYKDLEYEEGAKWSSAFYDRVTEVSVHSYELNRFCNVEKCGMCLLYAEDAEKLKCDVMSRQEQDEPAASGSGDLEANGSDESEEASGSDDSEGESGSDESVAGPGLTYVFSTTNNI